MFQLSTIFNISIDDFFPSRNTLLTVAERKAEFKVDNMKSYDYFPISVSAGLPINVEPTVEAKKITIPDELLGKHAGGKNIYFMKVNGDSMNKIIPHDSLIAVKLRHTHATMLVESGVDIKTIQKRLGHSRAAITEDRYVHLTQKMARNAADVFDSIANNL